MRVRSVNNKARASKKYAVQFQLMFQLNYKSDYKAQLKLFFIRIYCHESVLLTS